MSSNMTEEQKRKLYPQTKFKWYERAIAFIIVWYVILNTFGIQCSRYTP